MRWPLFLILLTSFAQNGLSQQIAGRWYGKITQEEGGYSQLYDLELLLSQRKKISGESYAFIPNALTVKINLRGFIDGDSIRLSEYLMGIKEEKLPANWVACIKNINVKYYKKGDDEFLKGVWNGKSKEDGTDCLPGEVILSKSKAALDRIVANGNIPDFPEEEPKPIPVFSTTFQNTTIKPVNEIEVHNRYIELRISDYHRVDNDTISIFFNRERVLERQRISKKQIRLTLNMNPEIDLNEVILFAENLGSIPPNTSQLLVIDGNVTHRLIIESDKQKSAALYLKYRR